MDRSKPYKYNLRQAYIKIRWRDTTFVLFFISKTTKLVENKTRELGCYFRQQWVNENFQLFILNKKQTKKIINKKNVLFFN